MDLQELSIKLADYEIEGSRFDAIIFANEQEVLQVVVENNEDLPIFVTQTDEQMLCITYLFDRSELKEAMIAELNETLLKLNVPIPLSSFAIIDNKYAIFGALSVNSSLDDIAHELVTLADNASEALEAIEEYLQ